MNRKTALDIIKVEYAKHGKMTQTAIRAMPNDEVRRNAGKGGVACVKELERRKAAGVI